MTISITDPAVEAVIRQRVQSGAFEDAADVVRCALASQASVEQVKELSSEIAPMTIDELFAPLHGLNLEFERNPSTGRPLDL